MKNRLSNNFFRTAAALARSFRGRACKDDVALPMQRGSAGHPCDSRAVVRVYDARSEVEASCDWTIPSRATTPWAELAVRGHGHGDRGGVHW